MNIDLNQLQEEALKKEAEELEQQEEQPEQPEQIDEPAKEKKTSSRESKISKTIAGAAVAMSATALGINFIPKPECAPNDTTALTALQQENEDLKERYHTLRLSRKIRGREYISLKEKVLSEEELRELRSKAEEAESLAAKLKEEQQYSRSLEELLQEIKERRKTNKNNAQSRQDYKDWLMKLLEEEPELLQISGSQQWFRKNLAGEEGETFKPVLEIGGSLTSPLAGEEGQDLGILDGSNGAMWLGQSDSQMDQLSRIIGLFMALDNTAFADGKHEYKTKQEMVDGIEKYLTGFLEVQNERKERDGE